MIEYIQGELSELSPTLAVIEAAGVGYAINIALTTFTQLSGKERSNDRVKTATLTEYRPATPDRGAAGQVCRLYCTEIIREDTHELYGFPTKGERQLFEMLMTVSGIGGNTARLVMSAYSAKVLKVDLGADTPTNLFDEEPVAADSEVKTEAVSALTMLGFAAAASSKAVDKILTQNPQATVEAVIRQALKLL